MHPYLIKSYITVTHICISERNFFIALSTNESTRCEFINEDNPRVGISELPVTILGNQKPLLAVVRYNCAVSCSVDEKIVGKLNLSTEGSGAGHEGTVNCCLPR